MKNNLNSNTILGIHNCCEKCSFIGRCAVGLQELELLQQEAIGTQPEFWKTIAAQFQTASDLIHEQPNKEASI